DVLRRSTATALPALAGFFTAHGLGQATQANAVAFGTIVATQLSQTLDAGWTEGNLNRSVLGAVAGSAGMLVSALTVRPVRNLLGLPVPNLLGWGLIGRGAMASVLLSRALVPFSGVRDLERAAPRRLLFSRDALAERVGERKT